MKKIAFMSFVLLCSALCCAPVWAELYQYTDRNGNIVFTDKPPAGANAREKQLRDDGINWSSQREADHSRSDRVADPGGKMPEEQRKADYSAVKVELYMTDWCGYCKKAREYVRTMGASLVEYNIDRDPDKKDEMRKKSGGSSNVPLIDVHGTIIRGYNPTAIKAAVERVAGR